MALTALMALLGPLRASCGCGPSFVSPPPCFVIIITHHHDTLLLVCLCLSRSRSGKTHRIEGIIHSFVFPSVHMPEWILVGVRTEDEQRHDVARIIAFIDWI